MLITIKWLSIIALFSIIGMFAFFVVTFTIIHDAYYDLRLKDYSKSKGYLIKSKRKGFF